MKIIALTLTLAGAVAIATGESSHAGGRRCCAIVAPHSPVASPVSVVSDPPMVPCVVTAPRCPSSPHGATYISADTPKAPEALPPPPKADPKSTHVKHPTIDGVIIEVMPDKSRRLLLSTEVCLREGPLEVLLCKKGTKEHEAILKSDVDAQKIHELLLLAGAEAGTPTQFVDPKTEQPKYKAATGSKIEVTVHYTKDGKTYTHPAQDWIWDLKRKAPIAHGWVFAGSMIITDPDNGKKFYAANSGDIISISNFPYSMLEIPSEISKDDAQLTFEAKTERIPPLMSKVWLIMEKK